MINHVINGWEEYQLEFYRTARDRCPAAEFLSSLAERPRVKVSAWLKRLREEGPDLVRPYADVVAGPIRELRVGFGGLSIRLLYFIEGRNIVVTHGFLKKRRALPEQEILYAMSCRRDWLGRKEERHEC